MCVGSSAVYDMSGVSFIEKNTFLDIEEHPATTVSRRARSSPPSSKSSWCLKDAELQMTRRLSPELNQRWLNSFGRDTYTEETTCNGSDDSTSEKSHSRLDKSEKLNSARTKPHVQCRHLTTTLHRQGRQQLGIDVDFEDGATLLVVEVLPGGIVDTYNRSKPRKQIKVGDRICKVNGIHGDPEQLMAILAHAKVLKVKWVNSVYDLRQ